MRRFWRRYTRFCGGTDLAVVTLCLALGIFGVTAFALFHSQLAGVISNIKNAAPSAQSGKEQSLADKSR